MRFDAILHAAIPLLALVLLGTAPVRRAQWLLRPVRAVALTALACASAAFLVLHAQPSAPAPLEPFSLAVACALVGWLVLRESLQAMRVGSEAPRVLPLLAHAAATVAVGAGAATLALLSRAPAAWLGLVGDPVSYALCVLGGLFVRYALPGATIVHVGLAACAWLSAAGSLATPDGPFLPAMLLLFLVPAAMGSLWPRKRRGAAPEGDGQGDGRPTGTGSRRRRQRQRAA
jgi:hypothetical protein